MSIGQKLFALSILSIFAFVSLIAIGVSTQGSAQSSARWVAHSDGVLLETQLLVTSLAEMQRGYRTQPGWRRAIVTLAERTAALERSVRGDLEQASTADRIGELVRRAMDLERPGSGSAAAERERARMDVFDAVEPFVAEEVRASRSRIVEQTAGWVRSDVVAVVVASFVGFVLVFANLSFSRELIVRLKRLAENSARIARGDEPLAAMRGADEIAGLDLALHDMAAKLRDREDLSRRYALLASATNDVMLFVRRSDGRIMDTNAAALRSYGYAREELLQLTIARIRAPETLGDLEARLAQIDCGPLLFETLHRRKDGTTFPVEVASTLAQLAGEAIIVTVARDVSERKTTEAALTRAAISEAARASLEREIGERREAERRLAHAAFHDDLTGLPNRAFFTELLAATIARQTPQDAYSSGVLFLDLDRFKVINDSLGHSAGDALLVQLARRLEQCLRSGDTLARFGGDEFTLLIERLTDETSAAHLAKRILKAFDAPFVIAGREVFASASIGVALGSGGARSPEDVLRDADIAMYAAKEDGTHYAVFAPALLDRAIVRQEVETDIRRALQHEEFRLHYQPIVALADGRLKGFEALIRWQHPTRGLLGPDTFVEVAEATGAIVGIGDWVLDEACRQMRAWRDAHPATSELSMSVNVAAQQLVLPTFAESVLRACERSGLPAPHLNVEITESAILKDVATVRENLAAMRAAGVRVHLDDFGTGYSSLSQINTLAIDVLKIDRSFVSSAGANIANVEIVRTILALARQLGIDVTAEGIETVEQRDQLVALDCPFGQGYLFSRPVDAARATQLIAELDVVARR